MQVGGNAWPGMAVGLMINQKQGKIVPILASNTRSNLARYCCALPRFKQHSCPAQRLGVRDDNSLGIPTTEVRKGLYILNE